MLKNQILTLHEAGREFMRKSTHAVQAKDAQVFFEMGLKSFAEAKELLLTTRKNSIILFLEISLTLKKTPKYDVFLAFCARNGLEILSETDFISILNEISVDF